MNNKPTSRSKKQTNGKKHIVREFPPKKIPIYDVHTGEVISYVYRHDWDDDDESLSWSNEIEYDGWGNT